MGRDLAENSRAAASVFDAVSEATGRDLRQICWELDEATLRATENAQISLFTCGLAALAAFREAAGDLAFCAFAGHSVGEYAAIVASGSLTIESGAKLVTRRGELMAASGRSRPGTMAAVLGLPTDELAKVCADASTADSVVVIANDNCPGQSVISGDVDAVSRASALASERGAKRVLPINVSGAFHSPLMVESAREMRKALDHEAFADSEIPVISNVTASPNTAGGDWPDLLERQLMSPVRWAESMAGLKSIDAQCIVEFGSSEVLCGLMKRIDSSVFAKPVVDQATCGQVMAFLTEN